MQRPARDVDGEINYRDVILEKVAAQSAEKAAQEHHQRQLVAVQMQGVGQLFDRKRRKGVELAIAFLPRRARRIYQRGGVIKFGDQPIDRLDQRCTSSGSTRASGSSVRTSKIEIIGSRRMNRKHTNRNRPMVPK